MESLSLIDVASEDDLLIPADENPADPQLSENHEMQKVNFFLESASIWEGENAETVSMQTEQSLETSESPELKPAKSGKFNLRKSLAWDSAFFTSEGVIENEELAIVIRKAEACKLTGIQEDLRKSSESTSTLNSETCALENLEEGLFDNLRASIQMSLGKEDKASSGVSAVKEIGLLNKVHSGSITALILYGMKSPLNSKKDGANKQQFISKESANAVKVGSGQSKSFLKPPRIVSKPTSTVPSSSASSGGLQLKGNGVNRQSVVASVTNGNLRSVTSRPNSSAKPSPGSRTGPISRSTTKTPSRIVTSRLPPSKLVSLSSSSPRSSIDSTLSSESSSSATNITKLSNSVESLGASSTSSSSARPRSSPEQLTKDHARNCTDSIAGSRCSKPSGLRMPSPKIGYFDGEKTQVRGSNRISQTSPRKSSVKSTIGTSNTAGGNKLKTAKSPTVRPAARRLAKNVDSSKTHSVSKSPNDGTRRPAVRREAEEVDSLKTRSASKSPNAGTRIASPLSVHQRKESTPPVRPAAQCDSPKTRLASKSPNDGVRRISPGSVHQHEGSRESISPVRTTVQRSSEKLDSPKTLSASKSRDSSTSRVSPMSMSQHEEPAENMDLFVTTATNEDDQDMSLKSADGRLLFSKELLKQEQEKLLSSTDGRDEHIESIDPVVRKSEKENLLPTYEPNGVTRGLPMYEPNGMTRHSPSNIKNVSMAESLAKQISCLSLSEK